MSLKTYFEYGRIHDEEKAYYADGEDACTYESLSRFFVRRSFHQVLLYITFCPYRSIDDMRKYLNKCDLVLPSIPAVTNSSHAPASSQVSAIVEPKVSISGRQGEHGQKIVSDTEQLAENLGEMGVEDVERNRLD